MHDPRAKRREDELGAQVAEEVADQTCSLRQQRDQLLEQRQTLERKEDMRRNLAYCVYNHAREVLVSITARAW